MFTRGLNLHLNLGNTGEDRPEERLGRVREASVEQFLPLGAAILLYVPLDLEQQKYTFLVLQVQVFKTKYAT